MKKLILATMFALCAGTSAQAMDVATFLAKGREVQAQGPAALLAPEARELQAELMASVAAIRRERLAAVRNGRVPAYCPRPGASLSQEEVHAALLAVPAPQRATTQLRDVVRAAFARKYPCGR